MGIVLVVEDNRAYAHAVVLIMYYQWMQQNLFYVRMKYIWYFQILKLKKATVYNYWNG